MSTSEKTKMPVIFLPHGGGPCFFMDWSPMGPADTWNKTATWLKDLHRTFPRPKAIVVISAHWEEEEITIQSQNTPALLFDYYGFPKHTYELEYPAHSSPALASRIQELLSSAKIRSKLDTHRGFDHGVFIPLKLIYPDADIPVVAISLKAGLAPTTHLELGKALAPLREEGVLILGSGMSYHNLRDLFSASNVLEISEKFDRWLNETLKIQSFEERNLELSKWESAENARRAHPREEHLLPLMVISGAAGNDAGKCVFTDTPMGAVTSAFQFG